MADLKDAVKTVVDAVDALEAVTKDTTPPTPPVSDGIVTAIVEALTGAGYTVTPPETETPAEDAGEASEEAVAADASTA